MTPVVYIAGPYTVPEPVTNVHNAVMVAEQVMSCGFVPLVPHLSMLWQAIVPHDYEFWLKLDMALLARCDALLRIPGPSTGADREVAFAHAHGIPIFTSVEDLVVHWKEGAK